MIFKLLLLSIAVLAQQDAAVLVEKWHSFFNSIDADHDGVLSPQELQRVAVQNPGVSLDRLSRDRVALLKAAGITVEDLLKSKKHSKGHHLQSEPIAPTGTCKDNCGGFLVKDFRYCFCDSLCLMTGDCCLDFCDECAATSTSSNVWDPSTIADACNPATWCPAQVTAGQSCFPPRVCEYNRECCCPFGDPLANDMCIFKNKFECAPRALLWSEQYSHGWTESFTQQCAPEMCDGCWPTSSCGTGTSCVYNLKTNPQRCNSCNNTCGADALCIDGYCQTACAPGKADCNSDGLCEDLQNDPNNCGGCGHACPLGPSRTPATCVNGYCEGSIYPVLTQSVKNELENGPIERFLEEWMDFKDNLTRNGFTAAKLARAAFHDAGTYLKGVSWPNKGGAYACLFRICGVSDVCELNNPENKGLDMIVKRLHKAYQPYTHIISEPDFFYLTVNRALWRASNKRMPTIPFKSGRVMCPVQKPYFGTRLPGSTDSFVTMSDFFEKKLGMSRAEWIALMGAHTLGQATPANSGHARPWVIPSDVFDNSFFRILRDESLIWDREPIEVGVGFPTKPQFQIRGNMHNGTMMLLTDMALGWCLKPGDGSCDGTVPPNCAVTHFADGCPRRTSTLTTIITSYANNITAFYENFINAMVKLEQSTDEPLFDIKF